MLDKLHELVTLLYQRDDIQPVLDVLVRAAPALLACDGGSVWLVNERDRALELVSEYEGHQEPSSRPVVTLQSLAERAFEENRTLVAIDDGTGPAKTDVRDLTESFSMLMIPLTHQQSPLGALAFTRNRSDTIFTPEEILFGELLAAQTGGLISGLRLAEQTQLHLEEIDAILHLTDSLAEAQDIPEIFRHSSRVMSELFQLSRCEIFTWDKDRNIVVKRASYLRTSDDLASSKHSPAYSAHDLSTYPQTLAVLETRKPVIHRVASLTSETAGRSAPDDMLEPMVLEVAMVTRGQALGVVKLLKEPGKISFDDSEIRLAQLIANQTAAAVRNVELTAATRSRVRELSTLFRISETLSLASDLRAIFNSARREIMALTNATGVGIALLDTPKESLRWIYIFEYGQELEVHDIEPSSIDEGFSGYVVRTASPLLENNITAERMAAFDSEIIAGAHTLSYMGLPVKVANEIIGVLAIENNETTYAFTELDLQLMATIASTLGVAIQNQRLLDQTQAALDVQSQQAVQLQAAADVSASASRILDLNELLVQAVTLIQERFDLYYVGLFLVDEKTQQAVLRAGTGTAGRVQLSHGHRLAVGGHSLIGGATADGQPRIVQDVRLASEWQPNPVLPDTRSELALPLRVRERVLGALTVQSAQPGEFSQSFVTILQTMGDQLATAIDNAQLLAATRTFSSQLRVAAEVSQAISTMLDPDVLLEVVVELVRNSFDLYYVGLFLVDVENRAVLRAGTGLAGQMLLARKHQIQVGGQSMIGQAIGRDAALVERDVRMAADWQPNPYLPDTRSEAAVPLRTRGRIIGALTFQSTEPDAFSADTITVLQTVADQLATAVENANLFAQLQDNLAETSRLYQFGRQMSEMQVARDLYESLVDFAAQTGLVDMAHVIIADPGSADMLQIPALWSAYEIGDRQDGEPEREPLPFAGRLAPAQVTDFDDWQPIAVSDPVLGEYVHRFQIRFASFVPIYVQQRWKATLVLNRLTAGPLLEQELQPFLTLCDQVAVVLANQQLIEETGALYQVSRALNRATSKDQVMKTTVNEIVRYTGVEQCRIVLYDRVAGYGQVVAEHVPSELSKIMRLPVAGDETYDVLRNLRQPLLLIDDDSSPNEAAEFYLRPFGLQASLLIPAISQREFIGFVTLDSRDQDQLFSQSNVNFAQAVVDQFTTSYERITLFDEAIQLARDVVVLNRIGAQFSSTLDLDELATVVYEQTGALLDNTIFILTLFDDRSNLFQPLLVVDGEDFKRIEPRVLSPTESLFALLRDGQPVLGNGEAALALAEVELFGWPVEQRPQSLLWAPIMQENRPIGLLSVQSYRPDAYRPGDTQLLATIATQAGLAISNARLFAETQERAAEWRLLFSITESAASSVDTDERLGNIVAALYDNLRGANVAIMLVNEEEALLEPLVRRGPESEPQLTTLFGSLAGQAAQLGQPLLVNDLRELPEYQIQEKTIMSQLVVPLNLGGRTIGVVNAQSDQVDAFTEQDLRLLQTLSVSLAATIQTGRLFQEIQQANERLRELDRLKTQFLANMSHELRTPLNSIIGFSKVILNRIDGPITAEQEEDLTAIHSSGQHLLNLINDILDLAKIEAGKMALSFELVDLEEMALSVHSTCRGLVKDKDIKLDWQIESDLPHIEGDPVRLRQIMLNFLSNAAKFTEKGRIGLRIQRHGKDKILLAISDTGIGIQETDFAKLFEAFEQLDSTPTRSYGGTGLGLPITHRLIEMHEGELWVESEIGKGTTFSVLLPIRHSEDGNLDPVNRTAKRVPGTGELKHGIPEDGQPTILIVDDEPGVISLYRRYLRQQPFRLLSAHSGLEALKMVRQEVAQIQLILLDINMPGLSGWEVLSEIRDSSDIPDIPIVVCSIVDEPAKANQLGAQLLLLKPIVESDLINALDTLGLYAKNDHESK
jgi:GAF domain-containing protein/ActR/RegA family two-component response regulator